MMISPLTSYVTESDKSTKTADDAIYLMFSKQYITV